jgi:hypothetical protein
MGFEREREESLRPSAAQGQWHGLSVHAGYSSRTHIMAMSKLPPEVSAAADGTPKPTRRQSSSMSRRGAEQAAGGWSGRPQEGRDRIVPARALSPLGQANGTEWWSGRWLLGPFECGPRQRR